ATDHSPIMPGERTGITATASDPDGDQLTYSYTATGGQVSGDGAKASFDSTGLSAGSYTVKCSVSDGRGGGADADTTSRRAAPPSSAASGEGRRLRLQQDRRIAV